MTALPNGVACPMVTPMRDGAIDTESLRSHVEWLVEAGIDGLVPCGTTGEFASLTDEERTTVVETTIEAADGRVPVLAGAADTTVPGAAERIDRVVAAGAEAALVPPPYYHGGSEAGLRRFYEDVLAASTGDVVLYNFPGLAGQSIPPSLAGALAERERVVGLKDSSGDFEYTLRTASATPDGFPIAVGLDRYLGTATTEGLAGGVVGVSNVEPGAVGDIHAAATEGDRKWATAVREERVDPVVDAAGEYGYVPLLKRSLAERGVIESPAVRPPLTEAPAEAVAGLFD